MTMIKTRFYFELLALRHREELFKEVMMPFLITVGQSFRIALLTDGQLDFVVKEPPFFCLTNMTLSVYLGCIKETDKDEWEECIRDCQRVGWRTFDQEFEQTEPNK